MKKQKGFALEKISKRQIEEITRKTEGRKDIPLIKSQQVNMRLKKDILEKAKKLAASQGVPYTSFLTRLLREDIERLWNVFRKAN